jgi:predicted DNA-binding transcriptional regulator AlpA
MRPVPDTHEIAMIDTVTADDPVLVELRAIREALATRQEISELLDKAQLAALTVLGESTLDKLRAAGKFGPADIRIGGALRWLREEVAAWIVRPGTSGELLGRAAWKPVWAEIQRRTAKR